MRTLVISDLHLGQRGGISVLERARPLDCLVHAIQGVDRLVLLGDIVELHQAHSAYSFPRAEPALRAVGEACGPDRPVIFVPGNHDHGLIRRWSHGLGESLERETVVPHDASPELTRVLGWFGPAQVEVRYPGVWLSDRTWATHGHYLNDYLRPVSSTGLLRPGRRRAPVPPRTPGSYEYLPESPAQPHMRDGLPPQRLHDHLIPPVLAPLLARVLARQMLNHSLPAMATAATALGVEAEFVIFGHVHRRGALGADPESAWIGRDGRQRLFNTGSWRYEPVVCHGAQPPHPYWPGGAVIIEDDGAPRSVGLLDHMTVADFR